MLYDNVLCVSDVLCEFLFIYQFSVMFLSNKHRVIKMKGLILSQTAIEVGQYGTLLAINFHNFMRSYKSSGYLSFITQHL